MRKDWDEYFMDFAILAAARSGCLSRQVGCVIVKDNRVETRKQYPQMQVALDGLQSRLKGVHDEFGVETVDLDEE